MLNVRNVLSGDGKMLETMQKMEKMLVQQQRYTNTNNETNVCNCRDYLDVENSIEREKVNDVKKKEQQEVTEKRNNEHGMGTSLIETKQMEKKQRQQQEKKYC